jgi:23S rRNA (pseudouridine1915-N3)-methyltransferase
MKLKLIFVGKTEDDYLIRGSAVYEKRLKNYLPTEVFVIPALKNAKNLSFEQQKQKEGDLLLKQLENADFVVLMDEKGKEFRSVEFAKFFQQKMNSGIKNLVLIIGGPYGFSKEVYARANQKVALSKMTFSHQMIRLLLLEQVIGLFRFLEMSPTTTNKTSSLIQLLRCRKTLIPH